MIARRRALPPRRRRASPRSPTNRACEETGDLATGAGPLRVALIYPNTYAVGMSSLGFHLVRQELRATGLTRVERAFAEPAPGRSFESNTPLADFDVLAFSVSFELDYLNVLNVLSAARVPHFASRRCGHDPLVIAGGVAVALNRHPIYPFADVLVHGEAEDLLEPVVQACWDLRRDRARLYEALPAIPGVEVTAGAMRAAGLSAPNLPDDLDERIETGRVETGLCLDPPAPARAADPAATPAVSRVVTPHAELGARVLAEIARGCPHRCTFCWLGHNCRAFLARPAAAVLAMCDEACAVTGCRSAGLIAAAVGALPEIDAICDGLLSRGIRVSFSSLRAEEVRPELLQALVRSGQRGLTLAPETGDEQLRRLLGKPLPDEAFLDVVAQTQRAGLTDLKLYFMVGLPTETDPMADAIVQLADRVRRLMGAGARGGRRAPRLSVNVGPWVPKPNTPLARWDAPPRAVVRARLRRVIRALAALPGVRVAPQSADLAAAQQLLSNGGLESAAHLFHVWKSGGDWRRLVRSLPPQ